MGRRRIKKVGKHAPLEWRSILSDEYMKKLRRDARSHQAKKEKREALRREEKRIRDGH